MQAHRLIQILPLLAILLFLKINNLQAQTVDLFSAHPKWDQTGSKIASAENINVQIWDPTGNLIFTLSGHTDKVLALSWDSSGTKLASSSQDKTIRIWDINTGNLIITLTGSDEIITAVSWTPDNTKIVGMKIDHQPTLLVWDAVTGSFLSAYTGGTASDISFSDDGSKFVYVTPGESIHILRGTTFALLNRFTSLIGPDNTIDTVAWRHDGNQLVTGSINGLIVIWDRQNAEPISWFGANNAYDPNDYSTQNPEQTWVRDVAYSADGSKIMAISANGNLRIWDSSTQQILSDTQVASSIYAAAFSVDGSTLAYLTSSNENLQTISLPTSTCGSDVPSTD
jgi:WD40 repeat protein